MRYGSLARPHHARGGSSEGRTKCVFRPAVAAGRRAWKTSLQVRAWVLLFKIRGLGSFYRYGKCQN